MHARLFRFILCSLALHLAVLWLFRQPLFEYGTAQGTTSRDFALAVTLVTDAAANTAATHRETAAAEPAQPAEDMSAIPARSPRTPALPDTPAAGAGMDYLTAGQLTRLPAPLEDIDLDVPEISALAFAGKAALTILIDVDGTVAGVLAETGSPQESEFADLVAAIFRKTRFTPGQIDGKPVRSKLQVTVVSEPAAAPGEQ